MIVKSEDIEYDFVGREYDILGYVAARHGQPPFTLEHSMPVNPNAMHKYRVRVIIDRIEEPGTEDADIHLGVVHAKEITPIRNLALGLTATFGALDEKAKA